jgi:TPR repeat protein
VYQAGRVAHAQKDFQLAKQLYEKAAGLNYMASYINLGVLSYQVSGTPKDYDAARRWYEKAVAANDPAGLNADAAPRAVREDRRLIGDDPP